MLGLFDHRRKFENIILIEPNAQLILFIRCVDMIDPKTDFAALLLFLQDLYEEKIPFNKALELQIMSLKEDGGVISSVLDVTGGAIVSVGLLKKMAGRPFEEIAKRIFRIGTIDLRIDFLRPGQGNYFLSTGSIMRMGNKVVVTRTTLHNDKEVLIAVGTGTYMLG